jgi:hypothetical protein
MILLQSIQGGAETYPRDSYSSSASSSNSFSWSSSFTKTIPAVYTWEAGSGTDYTTGTGSNDPNTWSGSGSVSGTNAGCTYGSQTVGKQIFGVTERTNYGGHSTYGVTGVSSGFTTSLSTHSSGPTGITGGTAQTTAASTTSSMVQVESTFTDMPSFTPVTGSVSSYSTVPSTTVTSDGTVGHTTSTYVSTALSVPAVTGYNDSSLQYRWTSEVAGSRTLLAPDEGYTVSMTYKAELVGSIMNWSDPALMPYTAASVVSSVASSWDQFAVRAYGVVPNGPATGATSQATDITDSQFTTMETMVEITETLTSYAGGIPGSSSTYTAITSTYGTTGSDVFTSPSQSALVTWGGAGTYVKNTSSASVQILTFTLPFKDRTKMTLTQKSYSALATVRGFGNPTSSSATSESSVTSYYSDDGSGFTVASGSTSGSGSTYSNAATVHSYSDAPIYSESVKIANADPFAYSDTEGYPLNIGVGPYAFCTLSNGGVVLPTIGFADATAGGYIGGGIPSTTITSWPFAIARPGVLVPIPYPSTSVGAGNDTATGMSGSSLGYSNSSTSGTIPMSVAGDVGTTAVYSSLIGGNPARTWTIILPVAGELVFRTSPLSSALLERHWFSLPTTTSTAGSAVSAIGFEPAVYGFSVRELGGIYGF